MGIDSSPTGAATPVDVPHPEVADRGDPSHGLSSKGKTQRNVQTVVSQFYGFPMPSKKCNRRKHLEPRCFRLASPDALTAGKSPGCLLKFWDGGCHG
jgi:hypothetical protein